MTTRDWENIYKTRGIVQNGVLHTVENAADLMIKNRCLNVLDLACGTGRHTLYLASRGFTVYGIDISESAINILKKRAQDLELNNINLKTGDMFNINFPDNFFDAILCVWSTGHGTKNNVKRNVDEMKRVLKKGGLVCADFMSVEDGNFMKGTQIEENTFLHDHIDHPDVPHHYSTLEELNEFFAYFKQKTITPLTYEDPMGSYIFKSFWVEAFK